MRTTADVNLTDAFGLCASIPAAYLGICAAARQYQQNNICAQRRLRSAWASAQSDQGLHCALNRLFSSCGQRRLWSYWADMSFCWFYHAAAHSWIWRISNCCVCINNTICKSVRMKWPNWFETKVSTHINVTRARFPSNFRSIAMELNLKNDRHLPVKPTVSQSCIVFSCRFWGLLRCLSNRN